VALNDLGAQCAQRGLVEQAEELLTRAAALKKRTLEPEHPDLAITLNNLAVVRQRRGDVAGAAVLYAAAVEIFERSLGVDHPKAVTCRANTTRCAAVVREPLA
jgi:Flp pilus assembly protein TadD